jgi:hypothetical protein
MAITIYQKDGGNAFTVQGTYLQLETLYARIEIVMEADGKKTNASLLFWQDPEAYDRQGLNKKMSVLESSGQGEIPLGFPTQFEFVLDPISGEEQSLAMITELVVREIKDTYGYEVEVSGMYKGKEGDIFDRNPIGAKDGEFPPDPQKVDGNDTLDELQKKLDKQKDYVAYLQEEINKAEHQKAEEEAKAKAEAEAEAESEEGEEDNVA